MAEARRGPEVFQSGCLTLQKLKANGTQRVEVRYQQVNVNEGGQALVTETVSQRRRGSRKTGRVPRMNGEPIEKRRGWLKNNNPAGDFTKASRCVAEPSRAALSVPPRSREASLPAARPAEHGATDAGETRPKPRANWKHGAYSQQAREDRRQLRMARRVLVELPGRVR